MSLPSLDCPLNLDWVADITGGRRVIKRFPDLVNCHAQLSHPHGVTLSLPSVNAQLGRLVQATVVTLAVKPRLEGDKNRSLIWSTLPYRSLIRGAPHFFGTMLCVCRFTLRSGLLQMMLDARII